MKGQYTHTLTHKHTNTLNAGETAHRGEWGTITDKNGNIISKAVR